MKYITFILGLISFNCYSQDTLYSVDSEFNKFMSIGKLKVHKFEGKVKSFRYSNRDSTVFDPIYFITDYVGGKMNGSRLIYSNEGKLISSYQVRNDSLNGFHIYYQDTLITIIEYYNNNSRNGSTIGYDNNKLFSIEEYKDDKATGLYIEFYNNGKVKAKGNQLDGLRTGEWIEFDSTYSYYFTGKYNPKIYWTYEHTNKGSTSMQHFTYEKVGVWIKYSITGLKIEEYNYAQTSK